MTTFFHDLRYSLRTLVKSPVFAAIAILTLAIGIGANTAIFTVVNAVLLKPLPFPEPDRLVQVWESQPQKDYFRNVVNPFNFLDWRERTHSFEAMAAFQSLTTNLTGLNEPLALQGMQVSPEFFSIIGISPALGRSFAPEEGLPGHDRVSILSFGLWQSEFGGDQGIVGRKITVNGSPSTVVGVMPRGFTLPKNKADIWTPLPIVRSREWEGGRFLCVIARLERNVTLEQAEQDLESVARQSAAERPSFNAGWSAQVVPILADATENVRLPLLVLLGAVVLVLLIACANVANLLLMRAATRMRELAVRSALGAGRARIIQQFLAESLVLAVISGAVGIASAYWGVKALLTIVPSQALPRMESVHVDVRVLLFTLSLSVVSAISFGLIPSLWVSQVAPHMALQTGSVRTTARSRMRQLFVVAEIAVSLVLLAGAGLMLRSFHRLVAVNPGFEMQHILTMGMFTSPAKYSDNHKRADYFAALLDEIRNVPGVEAAGSIHFLPLQERKSGSCFGRIDEPMPTPATGSSGDFLVVSPGYFEAMSVPLVSGRKFDMHDRFGTHSVIMVNQQFVRQYLAGREPVGQQLNLCWPVQNPAEIVGVIADARQTELQTAPKPTIFVNNLQAPMYFTQLAVRTKDNPAQMAHAVQSAIQRVDPDQAVTDIQTMEHVFEDSVAQPRLELTLLLAFGGIAGLLAVIGIYGLVAHSVAQRTREIGIRISLGAQRQDVARMVLKEGIVLGAVGIGLGLMGAIVLTRVLRSLLFEVTPNDPATFLSVVVFVMLLVVAATLVPVRRATKVEPMVALRYE